MIEQQTRHNHPSATHYLSGPQSCSMACPYGKVDRHCGCTARTSAAALVVTGAVDTLDWDTADSFGPFLEKQRLIHGPRFGADMFP